MAFNDKYIGTFSNWEGVECVVKVQENGFSGAPKDIIMGATPCTLTTTDTKLHEPIQGSGCEFSIISEEGDDYSQLFLAPPHTYKIVVQIGAEIVFQGFLDNEFYREQFLPAPFEINLTASDGLKGLEVYEPDFLGNSPTMSLMTIVYESLKLTGLELPIEVKCSLLSEDMDIMDDSDIYTYPHQETTLFSRAQIFSKALDGKNAREVLEEILKPFNCKVYQDGAVWRIDRMNDKYHKQDNPKYIYYVNGVRTFNTTVTTELISIGGDPDTTENYWIDNSQIKEIQQPYSSQTITGDFPTNSDRIGNALSLNGKTGTVMSDALLDSVDLSEFATVSGNTSGVSMVDIGYNEDFNTNVEKGGFKIAMGDDMIYDHVSDTLDIYNTPIIYKTPIDVDNWFKDYESDTLKFSYNISGTTADASYQWSTEPTSYMSHWGMSICSYYYLVFEDENGNKKWLHFNKTDGYTLKDFDLSDDVTYTRGYDYPGLADYWVTSATGFRHIHNHIPDYTNLTPELSTAEGTFNYTVEMSLTNKAVPSTQLGTLEINDTLSTMKSAYLIVLPPDAYFSVVPDDHKTGDPITSHRWSGKPVFPNGVQISDISMSVDDDLEYDNTYTGILDDRYLKREAPELSLSLWNPVKQGSSDKLRGLVSETSSWVNSNIQSVIMKYWSPYTSLSGIDNKAGLGLWYDLEDLFNSPGTSTEDLGNRLSVTLLASYFTTYANTQEIYTGDIISSKPLSYRDVYKVEHSTPNKQFLLQGTTYDVQLCKNTIKLFELHADSVVVRG